MIIYFYLFIPLLFLSTESSSIRSRNHKNDLVPFLSSRLDTMKKDPNSLKIVSKDPFIIQLPMPNSKETEAKSAKEKDTKKKRPLKKRVSKIKSLRKKNRKRRDLLTTKTKPREEKLHRLGFSRAANETETEFKNTSRNSVDRTEILNALSSYPKKIDFKRHKFEEIRNIKNEEKINIGKTKKNNTSNLNFRKHHFSLSDRSKMAYPNTPKPDRHPQKYTYKDLMADRERLEQKIKYIKNMLSVNDSAADDAVRVRRRSDSDRTANKIAKMFLTLSAVNGLHDRKKSKCKDEDDDDDRVEDVWEKERRNNPYRKSTSSNEERYKVKKWIEFMKNKRSSGKICPCMGNAYEEDIDAFPLEQKLPKGYFLMEKGRSSEESSELYSDPFYYHRAKTNRNDNIKKRLSKTQDQEGKIKTSGKNSNRKLETPFEDLELYRSRARQILQNAEEILDRIKEEEEKRLATPNILMSQLKELTSKIHGDPRNNENDLIRKIQKNLGWGPLARPQDNTDGTFVENLKSFILDPYEKAKALTDESTKKLSSYLLRNLGKFQESSEEQEMRNTDDKADDEALKIYFEQVPSQEEKLSSANLAKEEALSTDEENLQNWKNALSDNLNGGKDDINKENNWGANREEPFQQEIEDIIAEKQKILNDYTEQSSKETATADYKELIETPQTEKDIVAESKPESFLEKDKVAMKLNEKETDENSQGAAGSTNEKDEKEIKGSEVLEAAQEKAEKEPDIVENKPFRGMEGTSQEKEGENNVTPSRDMQEEKEFEKKIEEIIKAASDMEGLTTVDEGVQNSKIEESEEKPNEDVVEKNEKENEKVGFTAPPATEETASGEGKEYDSTTDERVEKKIDDSSPSVALIDEASPKNSEIDTLSEAEQDSKETVKGYLEGDVLEPHEGPIVESEPKFERKQAEEELKVEENKSTLENSREDEDSKIEKESPFVSKELQKENEKKDSLNDEIIQKENGAIKLPEFADLVQETKQSSKEFSEPHLTESKIEGDHQSFETPKDESKIGKDETAKSNEKNHSEEIIRNENTDENLKAMFDNENNREDKEAEMIVKSSREDSTEEDLNTPLKATLEEQEPLDNQRSSSKDGDDYALLKETNSDDQKNEDINDETVKETLESKSLEVLGKENDDKTSLESEKSTENVDDLEKIKSIGNNDEVILKELNSDEILENVKEEGSETPLKAVMNNLNVKNDDETQEHGSSEEDDNHENLDKDGSNETNLKSSWNKEDLEKDDDISLKANIPNSKEREETNQDLDTLNSAKPDDVGTFKENRENNDEVESTETLVLNTKENRDETEKETNSEVNQNAENVSDKADLEETIRAQTPDEIIGEKETSKELLKALSNQEMKNSEEKASEETFKNLDENIQDEITENSDTSNFETWKADNQKKESMEEDELVEKNEDENLKAVLENETQENFEEKLEETLKAVNLDEESERSQEEKNLEATLENQDNDEELKGDTVLKESNTEESEEDLKDNDHVEAIFKNQDQTDENDGDLNEVENQGKEEETTDDKKILLQSKDLEEEENDKSLKVVSSELFEKNLGESFENVRAENPEEDTDKEDDEKTLFRIASLEDAFDNKIEYETPLKSTQSIEETPNVEPIKDAYETESGEIIKAENVPHDVKNQVDEENETESGEIIKVENIPQGVRNTVDEKENESESVEALRAENVPHDVKNQIDEESENETILESIHQYPDSPDDLNEDSYETLRENLEGELSLNAQNLENTNFPQETFQDGEFNTLGDTKKPEIISKSLKASKLKVPESIRKIMKDLEGKEKSDITSIQNLKPDEIDHMLDKIGEAEQQNQLESDEVDCKKECACAEEMSTRSRNIGRYEIVKDFLHWVKDLQLNRVLGDD